jgi:hypothetical protein
MKKNYTLLLLLAVGFTTNILAQTNNVVADQNPNYMVSQAKYMQMADSINQLHGTTLQNTYKAYDWYQAKQERRNDRITFRRQLRLERVKNRGQFNNGWYHNWNNGFYPYGNFNTPFSPFFRWP